MTCVKEKVGGLQGNRANPEKPLHLAFPPPYALIPNPQSDLHHQGDRVVELQPSQGDPESPGVPDQRGGDEVGVHGVAEYLEEMDNACAGLEPGSESAGYQIHRQGTGMIKGLYTKILTGPGLRKQPYHH